MKPIKYEGFSVDVEARILTSGIIWLLKANPAIAHELVIGLGRANVGEGRLG
jgi:hypothetical protein